MQRVTHREPVSISHPDTHQFVAVRRGDEFPDDHPFTRSHAWLFEPDPDEPGTDAGGRPVVETASNRPGTARRLPPRR